MPSFPTGDFRRLKCLVLLSIHAMLRVQMQIFSCHLRDPVPIPASSPVLHLLGCNGLCDYIRDTENNPRCPCIPHYQRHGGRFEYHPEPPGDAMEYSFGSIAVHAPGYHSGNVDIIAISGNFLAAQELCELQPNVDDETLAFKTRSVVKVLGLITPRVTSIVLPATGPAIAPIRKKESIRNSHDKRPAHGVSRVSIPAFLKARATSLVPKSSAWFIFRAIRLSDIGPAPQWNLIM
ncbi:hypothetical protein EDC04DRAFT_2607547 [Pisolithus marmoratus]|nr:hypothetical protein EDC04DRAFT_2607547 [Pisolithus marmoratus]